MSVSADKPAIHLDGVCKRYGRSIALDGAELRVMAGEACALLGPNGSGKTTLLRILATVTRPTEGAARVFGMDVMGRTHDVRRTVGYAPQLPTADLELTCVENLKFVAGLFNLSPLASRARVPRLLDLFGLAARGDRLAGELSGGMGRRLELARAMVHEPRVLLLDEPGTGLDPRARDDLWELLNRLRREHSLTMLMATHRLDDAQRSCERVAVLKRGRVTATARMDEGRPLDEIYPPGAEED